MQIADSVIVPMVHSFTDIKEMFHAHAGRWIGAKAGLFSTRTVVINDSGYADFDWFRVEKRK